ncbi:Non-specific serine/threonine protein kinase [Bertholletia excelsa]
MMTGKRPTDSMFDRGFNLHKYAQMALPEQVNEILDPKLVKNIQETAFAWVWALDYVISAVMKIGVDCSMSTPKDRMSMSDVVSKLNLVRDIIQGTQSRVGLLL